MIGSETYANAILDAVLGDDHSTTIPSSLQVRLYAGSPLTGGVELSGGGYAPLAASNNTATWAAAASRVKANAVDLVFATSSGAWSATGTHFAVTDTSGVIVVTGELGDDVAVTEAGQAPRLVAGSLTITA